LIFGLNFFLEFEFELVVVVVVVVVVAVFSVPTNRFEVGEGVLNASSSLELSSFCSGGGEKGEFAWNSSPFPPFPLPSPPSSAVVLSSALFIII
jgi:hypothetical protein